VKLDDKTQEAILIKRYARVRLYDTVRPRYVNVEELREWRERGIAFEVRDAETGEDVPCVLLA
jgi:polyhydroxyalkanoate synthesis regulator protein